MTIEESPKAGVGAADMVIISNGFSKFYLAVAAAEAHRRGVLARFITGAYPTSSVRRLAACSGLVASRKFSRLLARGEDIPDDLVNALPLPEAVHQAAGKLLTRSLTRTIAGRLNVLSLRLYGRQAIRYVRQAATHAGLYHYRAGFGHESARVAKSLGMLTLCDHSIAHPALLSCMVERQGRVPAVGVGGPIDRLWSDVLHDIEQADAVLVNSDFVKDTFHHQGWAPSRVHVIYWGVDDQFLKSVPARLNRTAVVASPLQLLFAGSLERRKGAETLISALESIDDMPWRLTIAGPVSPAIGQEYPHFLRDSRVTLLGTLSRTELAREMSAAEVFVFPSFAEGSARVVFEALACGCYVITTPNSGSIVEDGVHGALVPPGDATALAGAIRHAMHDRKRLAEIGNRNACLMRSRYRQRDYGDALISLYRKLLSGHEGVR